MCNAMQRTFFASGGTAKGGTAKCVRNSRRLELSISKNTPHGRRGQGPGSVDPRFPAGLPFLVPEILEFVAFRDSGKFFQQFSRSFPGTFLQNSCTDPGNSRSLLEFSESGATVRSGHVLRLFLYLIAERRRSDTYQSQFGYISPSYVSMCACIVFGSSVVFGSGSWGILPLAGVPRSSIYGS